MIVHAALQAVLQLFPAGRGRHGDNGEPVRGPLVPDQSGRLEAIHDRHLEIHQDNVEPTRGAGYGGNRLPTIVGHGNHHPNILQLFARHLSVDGVILHDKHPTTSQGRRDECRIDRLCRLNLFGSLAQGNGEHEDAPVARFALHPDFSSHQLDQPPGDAETQAGTAVAAGSGAVRLHEGLEEVCPLSGGHTDTRIADGTGDQCRFGGAGENGSDFQVNFSLIGEFYGVPQQVDQDLAQPKGIADHLCRNLRGDADVEIEPPFHGLDLDDALHGGQAGGEGKIDGLQGQLSGFYLGEVQEIVNEVQERPG